MGKERNIFWRCGYHIIKTARTTSVISNHQSNISYSSMLLSSRLSPAIDSALFLLSDFIPQIKTKKFWLLINRLERWWIVHNTLSFNKTFFPKKDLYFTVFSYIHEKFNILFHQVIFFLFFLFLCSKCIFLTLYKSLIDLTNYGMDTVKDNCRL